MPKSSRVEIRNGIRYSLCPQCQTAPVQCKSHLGTAPRCDGCLTANRTARLQRQKEARAAGTRLSHHDANGHRYETRNRWKTCFYCRQDFRALKLGGSPVIYCTNDACITAHRLVVAERKAVRIRADRVKERQHRLKRKLVVFGVTMEWYLSHQYCGICGCTESGTPDCCLMIFHILSYDDSFDFCWATNAFLAFASAFVADIHVKPTTNTSANMHTANAPTLARTAFMRPPFCRQKNPMATLP